MTPVEPTANLKQAFSVQPTANWKWAFSVQPNELGLSNAIYS